jgi:hypothetical protein
MIKVPKSIFHMVKVLSLHEYQSGKKQFSLLKKLLHTPELGPKSYGS